MEEKYFIAWVAGFWEGEGSISKKKDKQNYSISIAQNTVNKSTIDAFKRMKNIFGGNYHFEKTRDMARYQIGKRKEVIKFVESILPYCIIRPEPLQNALIDIKLWEKEKNDKKITGISSTMSWRVRNYDKYKKWYKNYYGKELNPQWGILANI